MYARNPSSLAEFHRDVIGMHQEIDLSKSEGEFLEEFKDLTTRIDFRSLALVIDRRDQPPKIHIGSPHRPIKKHHDMNSCEALPFVEPQAKRLEAYNRARGFIPDGDLEKVAKRAWDDWYATRYTRLVVDSALSVLGAATWVLLICVAILQKKARRPFVKSAIQPWTWTEKMV
jgi:hypothetical protein